MAKKYHVWLEDENGNVMLLQTTDTVEDISINLSFFRKGILKITYEEED